MSADAMEDARTEAVQEMASALLRAAGEVMKRHGDDPMGRPITAAGFVMAINQIGKNIDPKFPTVIRRMLDKP